MIAVKRLQSLFWILLVTLGVLGAYLVNLKVATERNAVMRVRQQIAKERSQIRYLETEFSARASMRQLEKWNAETYRYSTPTAERYLAGERALAHLDGIEANGPNYVAPPVMVAMVESDADLPAAAEAKTESPATTEIRSQESVIRSATARRENANKSEAAGAGFRSLASASEESGPSVARAKSTRTAAVMPKPATKAPSASALERKAQRMAMLDSRLLDDGGLAEVSRRAGSEARRGR